MHSAVVRRQRSSLPVALPVATQGALLLLLAWLPTLAFLGHWSALAAPVTGAIPASHAPAGTTHHQHCHSHLDGCAGGSAGLLLPAAPAPRDALVPAEALHSAPLFDDDARPPGHVAAPLTPPPRRGL